MTILGNVYVGVMSRGLAIVDDAIVQPGCRQWRSFKPIMSAIRPPTFYYLLG